MRLFDRSLKAAAVVVCALHFVAAGWAQRADDPKWKLEVSTNQRFFQYGDGAPFFWLADTGWLMFKKLDREETERYLDDRRAKGFNVVQVMVLHTAGDVNAYGSAALIEQNPGRPNVTPGSDLSKEGEYDFWDHADWIVDSAAKKGIYIGMVAAWGSVARGGHLNDQNVEAYTRFLAERYKDRPNIIWITGGDTHGDREAEVWRAMGRTFQELDPYHLVTFHPFGRTQSSTWFHAEPWLDFNMFQSGHRRYDQDDTPNAKGEDNWRYVLEDYALQPPKPTLDGEPSYEGIPQGLHDPKEPYWDDADARRYAYWPVFAGAAGHTYGHSAVMQMHKPDSGNGAYGVRKFWYDAIDDPGAGQMLYLKRLMLSRPYHERISDQSLIAGNNGERYEHVMATRGESYAFAYSYSGGPFRVKMGVISGEQVRAWWYDPRDGSAREAGVFANRGERQFDPPGDPSPGNDWVLVLDDAAAGFSAPGAAGQ
ncbi:MAG: glycoside hydrolase family 140 protein [Bryobacterales bacterium]